MQSLELCRELGDVRSMAVVLLNLGVINLSMRMVSQARAVLDEALLHAQEARDEGLVAAVQIGRGSVLRDLGLYDEARALTHENLITLRRLGDRQNVAQALYLLAMLDQAQGNFSSARLLLTESLPIYEDLGNNWQMAEAHCALAGVLLSSGDFAGAHALYEQGLAQHREGGPVGRLAASCALVGLGHTELAQGNSEQALSRYREAMQIKLDLGAGWDIPTCLDGFARVASTQGETERAARIWGAAEALQEATSYQLTPTEIAERAQYMDKARGQMSASEWSDAWKKGRSMTMQEAVAYAYCRLSVASSQLSVDAGQPATDN
jgi:tetratricopeptide (TPR) repeat protein